MHTLAVFSGGDAVVAAAAITGFVTIVVTLVSSVASWVNSRRAATNTQSNDGHSPYDKLKDGQEHLVDEVRGVRTSVDALEKRLTELEARAFREPRRRSGSEGR